MTQKNLWAPPVYEFTSEQGPPHAREFVCTVKLGRVNEQGECFLLVHLNTDHIVSSTFHLAAMCTTESPAFNDRVNNFAMQILDYMSFRGVSFLYIFSTVLSAVVIL